MGKYCNQTGVVEIDGEMIPVRFRYVDGSTIECVTEDGNEFWTHYKSLVKVTK